MNKQFRNVLLAGVGGAVAGGLVWFVARRSLDGQFEKSASELDQELVGGSEELRRKLEAGRREMRSEVTAQVRREIPPAVDRQLRETLDLYGITPQSSREIVTLIERTNQAIDAALQAFT